ncbi:MAG: ABC transporter permease [Lachnospiraceae bacterium]|jgi:ribose transport system permease protein|nr:ABC transporter permease [Lachnospiraceae bacterium]
MNVSKNMAPKTRTTSGNKGTVWRILEMRELSIAIILGIMVVFLMIRTRTFATSANIRVLIQGMSVDMMIAIPMAISLIAGNIDFSVGSALCLSSYIGCMAMGAGMPGWLGILVGLGAGAVLGGLNALIINKFKITPLIATLGTWMAYQGIALVLAGGNTVSNLPESFKSFGRMEVAGIPFTILYMLVIVAAGIFVLKYINFFHEAYFIGSNKNSALLAGINTKRFIYVSYALTGVVSAFAGMTLAARLGSVSQNSGTGLEFRNVVALLIGGVSMDGGEGSLVGVVLGVTIMQVVSNALVLLDINASYTKVIQGAILIIAVAIDQMNKQRKLKAVA